MSKTPTNTKGPGSSKGSINWQTPRWLYDFLDARYDFTLDPCAAPDRLLCPNNFTEAEDGLAQSWEGHTVFCNPPYSYPAIEHWCKKAVEEHMKGVTVVMLVNAVTCTKYFHDYLIHQRISFFKGRIAFINPDTGRAHRENANGSMVVVLPGENLHTPWLGYSLDLKEIKARWED